MKNNETNFHQAVYLFAEFRTRLIYSLIVLSLIFSVLLFFSNNLYHALALPLLKFLPQGHLIATKILSPFFVPFKLALMASLLLGAPFFLYQIWAFVAPALYGHERRMIWPFLLMSTILFYAGILFAYTIIFPMLFHFLSKLAPEGVILMPDIGEYLDFAIKLLLIFGSLFQIPILMICLVSIRLVTYERLVRFRSYAIVLAFVMGMLLAPPDVMSQFIVSIPICFLYEIGLIASKIMRPKL